MHTVHTFENIGMLCTACVTYACPKLYVTSFPVSVSVSVSVQLQPSVSGIGRQHGIGLTLLHTLAGFGLA